MKQLTVLILGLLIMTMSAQSQSLESFEGTSKSNLTYSWTDISSTERMQIEETSVEFVEQKAKQTHKVSVQNHISKNSYISPDGVIIKGILQDMTGKVIGTARFARVGTSVTGSVAGTADIGNNTYKFRPGEDGIYYWELEDPFVCGTKDVDHNDPQKSNHKHGPECHHDTFSQGTTASEMKNPTSCMSESIQDVAFVTDDLMTSYGNDLNAILA